MNVTNINMLLSIVIPNHNREKDVLETLHSIYNQDFTNYEVIVVDDASTDNSTSAIRESFPDTKLIALTNNQGPGVARNIGIEQAKGDIIVGIDSDAVLDGQSELNRLTSLFSSRPDLACVAFRVLNYYDKKEDIKTWWHPFPISDYAGREFCTDYFSGTGYAFRRIVFEEAGYYPDDLFMHGEENDLAFRILDSGFDIIYSPEVKVLHKVSEQSRNNLIPFYYHRRNQIWMVTKYYPFTKGLIFLLPRLLKTLFQALRHHNLGTYMRSLRDGIAGLPDALKRRRPLRPETWRRIREIHKGKHNRMQRIIQTEQK